VLSAGIFSVVGVGKVKVSGMWWLWTAITVPLTLVVVILWWIYKRNEEASPVQALKGPGQSASDSKDD
jgi:chromate transport protein ChrA